MVVGAVLYLFDRGRGKEPEPEEPNSQTPNPESQQECCGLHLVCEKGLDTPAAEEADYYDDEELDDFRGREADSYTVKEADAFRDVLQTLRVGEIALWAAALERRGIALPEEVHDEMLIIITEARMQSHAETSETKRTPKSIK